MTQLVVSTSLQSRSSKASAAFLKARVKASSGISKTWRTALVTSWASGAVLTLWPVNSSAIQTCPPDRWSRCGTFTSMPSCRKSSATACTIFGNRAFLRFGGGGFEPGPLKGLFAAQRYRAGAVVFGRDC